MVWIVVKLNVYSRLQGLADGIGRVVGHKVLCLELPDCPQVGNDNA